ncbi:hypothetical protein MMA231_02625 [Asticcacaulis sp. MM231]|uniref:hypothetical protein n=1 Tax=Asticcacaulis sp. MM231 TaxID=3157666 RepID=UPI0032D57CFD
MRKNSLLTATALGLVLGGGLIPFTGQALAETSISSSTTTPLVTSTTGDLTVTSDGTITLTSGTAITVDSNNTMSFAGAIDMSESEFGLDRHPDHRLCRSHRCPHLYGRHYGHRRLYG